MIVTATLFILISTAYIAAMFWGLTTRKLMISGLGMLAIAFAPLLFNASLGTGVLAAVLSLPASLFLIFGFLIAAFQIIRMHLTR